MTSHNPAPALLRALLALFTLLCILSYGWSVLGNEIPLDLTSRLLPPSASHWFGTDNLGRDLLIRCFQGLITSLEIGVYAALISGSIALLLASLTLVHPVMDRVLRVFIDTLLALPHLLLLILISFALGAGKQGVILAVAFTHWPKLTLLLRAEINRVAQSDYLMLTRRLGHGSFYCWQQHVLPALMPQWLIGILLIFPHAILHSSALSFLGFGIAPHEPSLGILLADALRFLTSGGWWLALFPGLILLLTILLFDMLARSLKQLWLRFEAC